MCFYTCNYLYNLHENLYYQVNPRTLNWIWLITLCTSKRKNSLENLVIWVSCTHEFSSNYPFPLSTEHDSRQLYKKVEINEQIETWRRNSNSIGKLKCQNCWKMVQRLIVGLKIKKPPNMNRIVYLKLTNMGSLFIGRAMARYCKKAFYISCFIDM